MTQRDSEWANTTVGNKQPVWPENIAIQQQNPNSLKIAKVGSNFCHTLSKPCKIVQGTQDNAKLEKFCRIEEILPNLVTLDGCQPQVMGKISLFRKKSMLLGRFPIFVNLCFLMDILDLSFVFSIQFKENKRRF